MSTGRNGLLIAPRGPLAGDTFNSMAVAPGGSTIYLGGAQLACIPGYGGCTPQPINAVFAISPSPGGPCPTPQALPGCEWVAPLTPPAGPQAGYYGHISGLAMTPNVGPVRYQRPGRP